MIKPKIIGKSSNHHQNRWVWFHKFEMAWTYIILLGVLWQIQCKRSSRNSREGPIQRENNSRISLDFVFLVSLFFFLSIQIDSSCHAFFNSDLIFFMMFLICSEKYLDDWYPKKNRSSCFVLKFQIELFFYNIEFNLILYRMPNLM